MPDDNSLNMLVNRLRILVIFVAIALLVVGSSVTSDNPLDGLRKYTRGVEFDFVEWEISALFNKAVSASLKLERFLDNKQQVGVIQTWLAGTENVINLEQDLLTAKTIPLPIAMSWFRQPKPTLTKRRQTKTGLQNWLKLCYRTRRKLPWLKLGLGLVGKSCRLCFTRCLTFRST